ncbi:hypothetical protein [uncultured Acetatifactor sp.]|nr:hypothetical protein [uncultured Acetatifactor sp.]
MTYGAAHLITEALPLTYGAAHLITEALPLEAALASRLYGFAEG